MANYCVFGSGISAIVTAFYAFQAGFKVTIFSKEMDPRRPKKDSINESSTWGGGPTRIMSSTEGDVYLGSTPIYPNMSDKFKKTVSEGGWLNTHSLTEAETKWLKRRESFNYHDDFIKDSRVFYKKANKIGNDLWYQLSQDIPELFENTFFTSQIIRSYDTDKRFKFSLLMNEEQNSLKKEVNNAQDIQINYPYLNKESIKNHNIAGIMEVEGYSMNLQAFSMNALNYLEKNGVTVNFESTLTDLSFSTVGKISHFEIKNKQTDFLIAAEYASLHLGAYDTKKILNKTPAKNTIMGVAGLWIQMKKPKGVESSMKAHFGGRSTSPFVDLNLIVNGDKIIVGGGYIFTGETPSKISEKSKNATYNVMKYALESFFPPSSLKELKILEGKLCSRSFTYDELPRMDSLLTENGGTVTIYAGDNTGTTSMAPCMAKMICLKNTKVQNSSDQKIIEMLTMHSQLKNQSDSFLSS